MVGGGYYSLPLFASVIFAKHSGGRGGGLLITSSGYASSAPCALETLWFFLLVTRPRGFLMGAFGPAHLLAGSAGAGGRCPSLLLASPITALSTSFESFVAYLFIAWEL